MGLASDFGPMSLYAIEDLDDAYAATKGLLVPFERSRWLKLALVVIFVGGPGANLNVFQFNVPGGRTPAPGFGGPTAMGPRVLMIIGTVVAIALLLGLLLLLIGSIMEFVLIESLRHEAEAVREYWGRRWRDGVRLFGFRIVIGLVVIGSALVMAALVFWPTVVEMGPGSEPGGLSILALLSLLPALVVLGVLVGLVNGFTTVFVVPIMVIEDCGVVDGWRRLWPTITDQPWQYVAYAVVGFALNVAAGILVGIVVGVGAIILLVPFGILGAIGLGLLATVPPLGAGVLVVVGVLYGLAILVVLALAQVPVIAYLRYYALLVLGDIDEAFDLIPDRREAIREEGS